MKLFETENVCSMPSIMKMELHRSKETGKYYVEYIQYSEEGRKGWWVNKKISAKKAQELLTMIKSLKDVRENDWE